MVYSYISGKLITMIDFVKEDCLQRTESAYKIEQSASTSPVSAFFLTFALFTR